VQEIDTALKAFEEAVEGNEPGRGGTRAAQTAKEAAAGRAAKAREKELTADSFAFRPGAVEE
jgi:hypothetical protein